MNTQTFKLTPVTLLVVGAIFSAASIAAANSANQSLLSESSVMIVTAPVDSPLTISTSTKTPRQPVPASDGSDYLKTIPGFSQIRNGGTNGDPVFRGMFGSRLRILTNDGEMLGACPSRMDAPTSYISPENFDVLNMIKGPQTVLWGPGNSAGTIRFDREKPDFTEAGIKGNASALTASNHRLDTNADISIGNEKGYVRLIGNKSRSNDYKDGNGDKVPSKWDKWNADIAVGWTPDEYTLLELTAGKGDGEARYAGRGMDGSQFKRDSLGLRFEKSNIGTVLDKVEASMYYNYADHVMDNYSLRSTSNGMGSGHMSSSHGMMNMPMKMRVDRETIGGRVMSTWIWSDYELRTGADMQTNQHRSNSNNSWIKDAKFQDYGVFGELSWNATQQGKMVSGARLDRVIVDNYKDVGASGRNTVMPAGFARYEYSLSDVPVMLYAGVGYTERFPDYWELFSPKLGPDGTSRVFDTLKTEKTAQLDIGAKYSNEQTNAWVSAYMGRVDDFILFRYSATDSRMSQVENVNAMIMGGELGIAQKLSDEWKADASLAYSWGENRTDGSALPQMPPLESRFGLSWEKGDWTTTGLIRVVSRQDRVAINDGNVVGKDFSKSAGFTIFSLNTAYKVNENVKLSAGVDNLFDKTYSEHLNLAGNSGFGYSSNSPVNEPGRTFWAKMNLTF
ncbi:TonB-dependent copper receptor [Providencia sp.]|uniref:TonB-dependent copper receptor n=1 Tax=Providencia sp. TaxID=589 RepID=UPI000E9065B3|nr:TonB-dependent copper receptor [Providencia sp.]MBP6080859.1 TonB-dependent copper receptor [Providencia sp.]HBO21676.1 TonB-dependent copper receptor [Providencia sp.]